MKSALVLIAALAATPLYAEEAPVSSADAVVVSTQSGAAAAGSLGASGLVFVPIILGIIAATASSTSGT